MSNDDDKKSTLALHWIQLYEPIAQLLGQAGSSFGTGFLIAWYNHLSELGYGDDEYADLLQFGGEFYRDVMAEKIEQLLRPELPTMPAPEEIQ